MRHGVKQYFSALEREKADENGILLPDDLLKEQRAALREKLKSILREQAELQADINPIIELHLQELQEVNFQHEVCQKGMPDGDTDYEITEYKLIREVVENPDVRAVFEALKLQENLINRQLRQLRQQRKSPSNN
ncbi:MAG: hypothetical protein JWM56_1417 [Candidatus Peribacteria bacterium]|nr:hypothetical protein [Candidatus Peribacteria bacterium]